jgi:GNAT superfamily N-acetyltransferase
VVVRDAVATDARSILEIRRRGWQEAYAHIFPADALAGMVVDPWVASWEDRIEAPAPRAHTLVAERDGEVVGFAALGVEREDAGLGELYAIYVRPDAWGHGAGRALMSRTLELLRVDGFPEAILWVLEDNPRTRRFYELAGWHADGGVKEEDWLETHVREVRYRIDLR